MEIEKTISQLNVKPLNHPDVSVVFDGNHLKITDSFSNTTDVIPYYRGQDVNTFFLKNVNPLRITKGGGASP